MYCAPHVLDIPLKDDSLWDCYFPPSASQLAIAIISSTRILPSFSPLQISGILPLLWPQIRWSVSEYIPSRCTSSLIQSTTHTHTSSDSRVSLLLHLGSSLRDSHLEPRSHRIACEYISRHAHIPLRAHLYP